MVLSFNTWLNENYENVNKLYNEFIINSNILFEEFAKYCYTHSVYIKRSNIKSFKLK